MCGIVGYIAKYKNVFADERSRFLHQGLVIDTLRGEDSTGLIYVDNDKVKTMRSVLNGPRFVGNKKFLEADTNGWFAIGHNRAATLGSIKQSNAHPFKHGCVAMVHNGTLNDKGRNLPKYNKKFEVDSEQIAYNLSQFGPGEATSVLTRIQGSYALVWWDGRDKSINFARNSLRPLTFGVNKNENMLYFMSEWGMLMALSNRMKNSGAEVNKLYDLEPLTHVKMKQGSFEPEVKKYTPKPIAHSHGGYRGNHGGTTVGKHQASQKTKTSGKTGKTSGPGKVGGVVVPICPKPANPVLATEMRMLYHLDVNEKLFFKPKKFVSWGSARGQVMGEFCHPHWGNCMWHGVIYDFHSSWLNGGAINRPWTVRPTGIVPNRDGKPGSDEMPVLLCQVTSLDWDEPDPSELGYTEHDPKKLNDRVIDEMMGIELFFGPEDELLFKEQLEKLLEDGCSNCTMPLTVEDHEDITWAGERGKDPICMDCMAYFTDPKNNEAPPSNILH